MQVSTIRPGLLVVLKTSVSGNVSYSRKDIEAEHLNPDGSKSAAWETEKHITDAAEHEAAVKVQGRASTVIRSVCSKSNFGLLCPMDSRSKLDAAIVEARALANTFNATSSLTRVAVYVMVGEVASSDAEAIRSINSEVRDLLAEMESGLQGLDVKRVRDAADKAKQLGAMLQPTANQRIQVAIEAARSMARRIVKAGESLSVEIDTSTLQTLKEARTQFLDLDEAREVQAPSVEARALDLEPSAVTDAAIVAAYTPEIEF